MKIRNGNPIFTARQVTQGGGDLIKDLIYDKLEVVDLSGYSGTSYNLRDYGFYNKKKLKKVILDSSKQVSVGRYCFDGSSIETIQGLSDFGIIEKYAFRDTNVSLQNIGCTAAIKEAAFQNCSRLTGILRLTGSETFKIYTNAFIGTNITQISIPNTATSTITLETSFYSIFPNTVTKIKVRSSMLDKYKANSNWSAFTGTWEGVDE